MSIVKAKEYLTKCGYASRIMEFDVSSATVKDAANAINCKEDEIAKSLSFIVDDCPILIIAAGTRKVDNAKFKAEFHTKAKMIAFDDVERLIGHAVGGVCPFGINDGVKVYLDVSLKDYDIVYPACGNAQSAVKLHVSELEQIVNNQHWVDVCKNLDC